MEDIVTRQASWHGRLTAWVFHSRRAGAVGVCVTVLDTTVVIVITLAVPAVIWPGTVTALAGAVRIAFAMRSLRSP